jgi:hypothetical protein
MAFASFVRVLVSVVCVRSAGASFALGLSDIFSRNASQVLPSVWTVLDARVESIERLVQRSIRVKVTTNRNYSLFRTCLCVSSGRFFFRRGLLRGERSGLFRKRNKYRALGRLVRDV